MGHFYGYLESTLAIILPLSHKMMTILRNLKQLFLSNKKADGAHVTRAQKLSKITKSCKSLK